MSTGLAGPVSAPAHSLPAGSPPTLGSHGALGSVGPSHVGVSALRYPSGQTDPLYIGGQVSTSSATGIVIAEIHVESEQSPPAGDTTTSRQPSATAAAARLPPEGPSHVPDCLGFNELQVNSKCKGTTVTVGRRSGYRPTRLACMRIGLRHTLVNKKLSYRRETARRAEAMFYVATHICGHHIAWHI